MEIWTQTKELFEEHFEVAMSHDSGIRGPRFEMFPFELVRTDHKEEGQQVQGATLRFLFGDVLLSSVRFQTPVAEEMSNFGTTKRSIKGRTALYITKVLYSSIDKVICKRLRV